MVFLSFYRGIICFGFVFLTELCGDGDVLLHGENPLYRAVDHAVDRLIGVESHVRRVHHVLELAQIRHIPVGEDVRAQVPVHDLLVVLHDVQPEGTDLAGLHRIDQIFRVHQGAAGAVDEDDTVLHLCNRIPIDHVPCLLRQRHVERDDVAPLIEFLEGYIGQKVPVFLLFMGIAAKDPTAEAWSSLATQAPILPVPTMPTVRSRSSLPIQGR